ncbi:hypothetical protein [Mesorhizobium sp. M2A.F.Ca.ET.043.05.1.1]|uniref:hypothetical protein n=1 Tax=Mesorhizobium sp. M2A.F.Ca.ET.043.05.1.1 TaxID=2493671 RepID=UPI001FDF667F|nr:hypothetical protein [Mesorhizobium sp. M2A.F.Ca.ET.043.05.1.1]
MRDDPENGPPVLALTRRGKAALVDLEAATNRDLARLTVKLEDRQAAELSDALNRLTRLLAAAGL